MTAAGSGAPSNVTTVASVAADQAARGDAVGRDPALPDPRVGAA